MLSLVRFAHIHVQGTWERPLKDLQDHLHTVYGVVLPDITTPLKTLFAADMLTSLRTRLVSCNTAYNEAKKLNARELDEKRDVHPLAHVLFASLFDIIRKTAGSISATTLSATTTSATTSSTTTSSVRSPSPTISQAAVVTTAVRSLSVYLEKLNTAARTATTTTTTMTTMTKADASGGVSISGGSGGANNSGVADSGGSGGGGSTAGTGIGDGRRRLVRPEDVLFHTHALPTASAELTLNACVQRKCATSIELKPTTKTAAKREPETTQISSAINELERDYVATIFGAWPRRLAFGLNVLGDGLTFYALRSQLALSKPQMRSVMSAAFDIDTENGLVAFGTLFMHLVVVAALGSFTYDVGWSPMTAESTPDDCARV